MAATSGLTSDSLSIFAINSSFSGFGLYLVLINSSTMLLMKLIPRIAPPKATILALRFSRAERAVATSPTSTTRVPGTLSADTAIPTPVPQRATPKSARPLTTSSAIKRP